MSYREFSPPLLLQSYIDAYWIVKGEECARSVQRVMPDSCIDIILNLGDDFSTDSGRFTMKNEAAYLVGTMTRYKDTVREPGSLLFGIRFKPLGFPAFFRFHSLHEITETTIEFPIKGFPEIHKLDKNTLPQLNHFFFSRLSDHTQHLRPVLNDMHKSNGILSIGKIYRNHFITSRQLERNFKQYLGITPKEYVNFIRYQHAVKLVKNNKDRRSLLDIALDAGYYDHAHLTNEIKKYSGLTPSQL